MPRQGACLIAANHLSFADPIALALATPRPLFLMAREELFHIPVLHTLMRVFLAFPVRTGDTDHRAIRHTIRLLENGAAVALFPEGGIAMSGRLEPLRSGAALLAMRTGAALVPAALSGTQRILPHPRMVPRRARGGVRVAFGPPLDVSALPPGLSRHEQERWLTERLRTAIAALLPEELRPVNVR